MDINTKKLKKNAFRVTKHRGITASRIRVPGGHLNAKYLGLIQEIAEKILELPDEKIGFKNDILKTTIKEYLLENKQK